MLDLDTALLKRIAAALGLDPKTLVRDEARARVQRRMEKHLGAIAKDMREDDVSLAGRGEAFVVRDSLFRLWRSVFNFNGGGHLADLARDSHDDQVIAATAALITNTTSLEDVLRIVMVATLDVAF